MKQFSKKGLFRINILAKIFLMSGNVLSSSKEYIRNIDRSKRYFEKSLINLNIDSESEKYKMLVGQIETATIFRENKQLVKDLVRGLFFMPFILCVVVLPVAYPLFFMEKSFTISEYIFAYLLYVICLIINSVIFTFALDYFQNFEIRIGKFGVRLLGFFSFVILCLPLYGCDGLSETVFKASLVSSFLAVYGALGAFILGRLFGEFLVDFVFYSRKIRITKSLILDSAFRMAVIKWDECLDNGSYRSQAMIEMERFAKLIEIDMSSHIIPGDPITNKWKNESLSAKANGIRRYKKELIIPGAKSAEKLRGTFDKVFVNIVNNNWEALPSSTESLRNLHRKTFFAAVRSFIVATFPVGLFLCVNHFAPNSVNKSFWDIGLIVSVLWLIVSVLMWLDPSLADKLATMKSMRSMFKGGSGDD